MNKLIKSAIQIPVKNIEEFCKKWHVQELALFGSVLREDFDQSKSDIDILIELDPNANISLFDLVQMKQELKKKFVVVDGSQSLKNGAPVWIRTTDLPLRRHIRHFVETVNYLKT